MKIIVNRKKTLDCLEKISDGKNKENLIFLKTKNGKLELHNVNKSISSGVDCDVTNDGYVATSLVVFKDVIKAFNEDHSELIIDYPYNSEENAEGRKISITPVNNHKKIRVNLVAKEYAYEGNTCEDILPTEKNGVKKKLTIDENIFKKMLKKAFFSALCLKGSWKPTAILMYIEGSELGFLGTLDSGVFNITKTKILKNEGFGDNKRFFVFDVACFKQFVKSLSNKKGTELEISNDGSRWFFKSDNLVDTFSTKEESIENISGFDVFIINIDNLIRKQKTAEGRGFFKMKVIRKDFLQQLKIVNTFMKEKYKGFFKIGVYISKEGLILKGHTGEKKDVVLLDSFVPATFSNKENVKPTEMFFNGVNFYKAVSTMTGEEIMLDFGNTEEETAIIEDNSDGIEQTLMITKLRS